MSDRCSSCGELKGFLFPENHKCKPIFSVRHRDSSCWDNIRATDHEEAAEKFAEDDGDDGDGPRELELVVKDDQGVEKFFDTHYEYSVNHYAEEVDP